VWTAAQLVVVLVGRGTPGILSGALLLGATCERQLRFPPDTWSGRSTAAWARRTPDSRIAHESRSAVSRLGTVLLGPDAPAPPAPSHVSQGAPLTATGSFGGPSPRRSEVGHSAPGLVPGQEHAVGKRPGLHQVQVHPVVQGREERRPAAHQDRMGDD